MGGSAAKVQASHDHKLDNVSRDLARPVRIVQGASLAHHPHDQRLLVAVGHGNSHPGGAVPPHADTSPRKPSHRAVQTLPVDLGGALAGINPNLHPNLHAFVVVVDGSDPDFVDGIETGAERRVLGVDAGALISDQVEPLARPAVDLIAEEEPGEVEGSKLLLVDLDGHGEENVAYDSIVDELLVAWICVTSSTYVERETVSIGYSTQKCGVYTQRLSSRRSRGITRNKLVIRGAYVGRVLRICAIYKLRCAFWEFENCATN